MPKKKYFDLGAKNPGDYKEPDYKKFFEWTKPCPSSTEDKTNLVKDLVDKAMKAHEEEYDKWIEHNLSLKEKPKYSLDIETPDQLKFKGKNLVVPFDWTKHSETWVKKLFVEEKPEDKPGTIGAIEKSNEAFWQAQVPNLVPPPLPSQKLLKTVWSLGTARNLIKTLQDWSRKYKYHVCLGGGVLNNSISAKDVDIYFLPLGHGDQDPVGLLHGLQKKLQSPLQPFYGDKFYPETETPYVFKGKLESEGRRVDVFVLGDTKDLEKLKNQAAYLIPEEDLVKQSVEILTENIVHFKKVKKG